MVKSKNIITSVVTSPAFLDAKAKREARDAFWSESPLFDLVSLPSKSKGTIIEKMAAEMCSSVYGLAVEKTKSREHDYLVNGFSTEIKGSLSWSNEENHWVWQQIRRIHKYERVVFVGINPSQVFMWWCDKRDLDFNLFPDPKNIQHGGQDGHQQMYWINTTQEGRIPSYFKSMEVFVTH